jgi:hypothetical protein
MGVMPILWIVWAGVATILVVLLVYKGTLTRYEEDQIFLDANAEHQQHEQDAILTRVQKVQPFVRIATGATCLLGAGILGFYVWDAVQHLR